MINGNTYFHVTPDYFYNGDEPLIFSDYASLNNFLNYSQYPCMVRMVTFNGKKQK